MKITKTLKQQLTLIAFQVTIGQISDLAALADALQALADLARAGCRLMTIKAELILFLVSIASSTAAAMIFVWKIGIAVARMQSALKEQITAANFDRKINDERLEHLQDALELGFNGLKEKFEHFSTRSRNEHRELATRIESVENFLVKTTEFEKR